MKLLHTYFKKFSGGGSIPPRIPYNEILWSGIGAFIGILVVYEIGLYQQLHMGDSLFLVGSFGASAVLIYGLPDSPYAQPRNLVLGQTLSALVGVSCALMLNAYPAISAVT